MGGTGQGYGNVTPVAEYNIWVDPEAAKIVFHSGLPIKMVGWDVSRACAVFSSEESQQLRDLGTLLAQFCVDIQSVLDRFARAENDQAGFDLPDPITMAIALDPAVATRSKRIFVTVETQSDLCRGQTVVDHLGVTRNKPNVEVVLEASRECFLHLLYGSVK